MTESVPRRRTVWPTRREIDLLHAALDDGNEAGRAWERWRAATGGFPDLPARRLLPLVEWNLRRGAPELPETPGFVEHGAAEAHAIASSVAPALAALEREGIRALVLKGFALGRIAYPHPGLRPMSDVDLLVPPDGFGRARGALEGLGWTVADAEPEARLRHLHGAAFRADGAPEIDLHARALAESAAPDADAGFFHRAGRFDVAGVSASTLAPADHLLVVCVHGLRWSTAPAIHWVADAAMLLRRFPDPDWTILLAEAAARGLEAPLALAFRFLRAEFALPVPDAVVDALSAKASRARNAEAAVRMSKPTLAGGLFLHWRRLGQERPGLGAFARLRAFPAHLKEIWALDHAWQVPGRLVRKSVRRVARKR